MKTQAPPSPRSLKRSLELLKLAERLIPGQSQTFSKAPNQFVRGVSPAFLERAKGSRVWDVDGNEYIDYSMALGPIILGYGDPDVDAAVRKQLEKGAIFSLPSPLEVEVAGLVHETVPCAEMVRFGKNGSDVTTAAVRAARAFTGREKVACCGYHGWQDWYIGTTTRSGGVPKAVRSLTLTFDYNDPPSLERLFKAHKGEIACVILEPVGVVEPKDDFLKEVARITRKNGALLVFDEVVTGFRVSLGGAQEHYGVTPDLACFGKAAANGFPLSIIAGRRDVMLKFNDLFFSSTFGGEALSLAAAAATIRKLKAKKALAQIWRQGEKLRDGFNKLAADAGLEKRLRCIGLPPHTVIQFKDEKGQDSLVMRSVFQQELVKRGILFLVGFNVCWSHDDKDVARTLEACREAIECLAEGDLEDKLEGPCVEAVFRKA
ncbi:MAG: aminotransferase class III-fold pyridoxal phosphate-dependent enzyme [Elusimicrobia bacterium]|nr:aminotransferase class III-fold pyridoxal phosphate-dependent enzyme [Elusimicrobiota bacterium]